MDVIIVGAGPSGLTLGSALARRRHRVVAIDRDPGPAPDGSWRRKGVMQFDQAHGFRPQVRDLLLTEWPEAWRAWSDLGAETVSMSSPGAARPSLGVRSRRSTYERALRRAATDVDGLNVATGSVQDLVEEAGRVVGVIVDGSIRHADLVIDASGRLSRLVSPATVGGDAGMAYVSRTFQRERGAQPGPMVSPVAWTGRFAGYDSYVFPHEHGHISVVLIRPTADAEFGNLRHLDAFEAASRAIPAVAEWTDGQVTTPTSGVLVGGGLLNVYHAQLRRPGLVAIGDAVATTSPTAGRGLAMASMQIGALLDMFDAGVDPLTIAEPFDTWCDTWMRPWVEDHVAVDAESVRRWQGHDLDLRRPLTSAAIVATAQADPRIEPQVAPFLAMDALPASLASVEPMARAVYETGWRPPTTDGPTRDELVALTDTNTHTRRTRMNTSHTSLSNSSTARPARRLVGQHAAPAGPVDLQSMYVIHHGFRRDVTAFIGAVASADIDDRQRWHLLRQRWELFSTVLHHHHAAEDGGLWPALLARIGPDDDAARTVLEAMVDEHALIDPVLRACSEAFEALAEAADAQRQTELHRSLVETRQLLDSHLGHEERDAMALVQRHLTPGDWQRIEREHFRAAYSPRALLSVVPWALSGLPADVRERMLADAGRPMAILWHAGKRSFARTEREAFGANPARLIDRSSPIAVLGATGTMGGHVLEALADRHTDVRALVRRPHPDDTFPNGVTQVVADLHDADGLRAALDGVRAALYISPHDADEEALAANFIRAAEATGTRIVFAGVHIPANTGAGRLQLALTKALLPTYRGKLRIAQRIARTRLDPVLFSPTNFFQNDEIVEAEINDGTFPLPLRHVNRVDVRDLAELCVRALLEPGHPAGEHIVAGPGSLTGAQCAQIWATALDRPVRYVGDDENEWIPIFERRLHGQKFTDFTHTLRLLGRRKIPTPGQAVAVTAALLGRPARDYADYVTERAEHQSLAAIDRRQPA